MNKKPQTVHEWLEKYYHFVLMQTRVGEPARDYLIKRGITKDMMKSFKLGYSPIDIEPTIKMLKSKKFSLNQLVSQNVLKRYESGKYKGKITDPFKGRIVLPITNFKGETVAFGARSVGDNYKIKYLNSPESEIFVKGDNLYRFDLAKEEIENQGYAILFEGYFDTITAHKKDIKNSLSTLGTALSVNQALLLKSVTKNVIICFDGDRAGMESAFRTVSVLKSVGLNVKVAIIPDGNDPDDQLKLGKMNFMSDVVMKAQDPTKAFIAYKKTEHDLVSPNGRYAFSDEVLRSIKAETPNDIQRVLKELGDTLNAPLALIYKKIIKEGGQD